MIHLHKGGSSQALPRERKPDTGEGFVYFIQEALMLFTLIGFIYCRGKNIFVNRKCLLLLKTSSVWLSGCSLDPFQFPSLAEQLPFLQPANPHKAPHKSVPKSKWPQRTPSAFQEHFGRKEPLKFGAGPARADSLETRLGCCSASGWVKLGARCP